MLAINQRDKALMVRMNRALAKNTEAARKLEFDKWNAAGRPGEELNAVQEKILTLPTATMTTLSFKNNPLFEKMNKEWMHETFPQKLGANKTITFLDLSALELSDDFAFAFAEHCLKPDTNLERINLSRNSFSGKGLTAIANKMGATGLHRIKLTTQRKGFATITITQAAEEAVAEACKVSESLSTCNLDWRTAFLQKAAERELMTNIREARYARMKGH